MTVDLPGLVKLAAIAAAEREANPIRDWRPSLAQDRWLRCPYPRAAWVDGNSLGKTWASAADAVLFAMGQHPLQTHPPPVRILWASESWGQMRPGIGRIWDLLPKRWIDPRLSFSPSGGLRGLKEPAIEFVDGPGKGSVIIFRPYYGGKEGSKKLAGEKFHRAYLDEPPPERFATELAGRLSRTGGYLRLTFTPTPSSPPLDWLRKKVEQFEKGDHDSGYFRLNVGLTLQNVSVARMIGGRELLVPFLKRESVEQFYRDLEGSPEREMRINGAWDPLVEGRVFRNWSDLCTTWDAPPVGASLAVGIDHGLQPGKQCAVLVAVNQRPGERPRIWALGEYKCPDGVVTEETIADGILAMIREAGQSYDDVDEWRGDISAFSMKRDAAVSNAGLFKAIQAKLHRSRDNMRRIITPNKAAHSVVVEQNILNGVMGRRASTSTGAECSQLLIHPRCKHLIGAFKSYRGARTDKAKDILDAFRYGCFALIDRDRERIELRVEL